MKTFFRNGIPPLGERSEPKSRRGSSVSSKEKHDDAVLWERTTFGLLPDELLCLQDTSVLWHLHEVTGGGSNDDWGGGGGESDIQQGTMVKRVLQTAIYTVGLQREIKCCNGLSIFDLRPDIWILCSTGGEFPIGVVKVTKPGEDDETLQQNPRVQGQLFDCMLRLQSYFGLERALFGILSSYEQWRVCWMPRSERAAVATTSAPTAPAAAEEEHEKTETPQTQTAVVPERVLHGSKVFAWDDANLARVLCTAILKMHRAPRSEVRLVDKNRPYIVMDESSWSWGNIAVEDESNLSHSVLPPPSANHKFTLLADLREGADGRAWRACTDSGLGCCIKFSMRSTQSGRDEVTEREQRAQMQEEAANWHKAYGVNSARVVTLSGRPALIMRYLRPLELRDGKLTGEKNQATVKSAIERFASKGLKHEDLAFRHLGTLSPPRKSRRQEGVEPDSEVVLFDLGRVSEADDPTVAVADMMAQLNLM